MVAGGQPHGLSPRENVVKECSEEAGIPDELAAKARAVGAVSYASVLEDGSAKRDVLFTYDLELPLEFEPVAVDGEVDCFERWPLERVAETLLTSGAFKPNCSLVCADFLVRHGFWTPEQSGYLELVRRLRSGYCA